MAEIKEFPKILNSLATKDLLEIYRQGSEKLSFLVCDLDQDQLREKPFIDKWSVQELVFHLLDAEYVGLVRMKMVLSEIGASLPFYDQELWAEKMDYNMRSLGEVHDAVRLFHLLRENNYFYLSSLEKDCWDKKGIHPKYGEITLRNLLEIYTDHSERHLEQILERFENLGIKKNCCIDLKERLY